MFSSRVKRIDARTLEKHVESPRQITILRRVRKRE
jgi:hypothetical protein